MARRQEPDTRRYSPPRINPVEKRSGDYARLYRDPPGNGVPVEIRLYMPSIRAQLPDWKVTIREDSFACGALVSHLAHEMFHQCIPPGPPGTSCQRKPDSCVHLAIDHAVHEILCVAAQETKENIAAAQAAGDTEEAIQLTEMLTALCEAAQELEDKWNTPDRADKAESCKGGEDPCPLSQDQMNSMDACFEGGGGRHSRVLPTERTSFLMTRSSAHAQPVMTSCRRDRCKYDPD